MSRQYFLIPVSLVSFQLRDILFFWRSSTFSPPPGTLSPIFSGMTRGRVKPVSLSRSAPDYTRDLLRLTSAMAHFPPDGPSLAPMGVLYVFLQSFFVNLSDLIM